MGKNKAAYFQNKSKKSSGIISPPKGSRGILVTCDVHGVHKAVDQVIQLIESLSDPIDEQNEAEQKEDSLEAELAALKNESKTKKKTRFIPYVSEVTGNFFIRFANEKDDPFAVLDKYFKELRETGVSQTPRVTRMYPIQASGFPSSEETLPVLEPLIKSFFKDDNPLNYEVVIQRKHKGNGQNETHDELNQKILDIVGKTHHPSFHKGDVGILWLSLGRNLYVSVVPKWKEWLGCNVPKCAALYQAEKESKQQVESKEGEKKAETTQ